MPLTSPEKKAIYNNSLIPITNTIREIERQSVSGDSHRLIEVTALCLHSLLDDLRTTLGLPFDEDDVNPSVYGENGGGKGGGP